MRAEPVINLFEVMHLTHEELKETYRHCTRCSLHHRSTQRVFWDGADRSPVMVVGEAPGAKEDASGVPFSGPAGVRWNALLAALSIERQKLHISNSVWCRPTDGARNLPPLPEHIAACSSRLRSEILLTNPRVIVGLGKPGTLAVLNQVGGLGVPQSTAMGKLRREWFSIDIGSGPIRIKPSWHPSYELRCQGEKKTEVNRQMYDDWTEVVEQIPEIRENP